MFQSYSSVSANSDNTLDPLGCEESVLLTEMCFVDTTQHECKSECSEENIELKRQQESGVLPYSAGNFLNIISSLQVSSLKLYY